MAFYKIVYSYPIFNIVNRIINGLAVPAVVTDAFPTTDEIANTIDGDTTSIARPWIHVVPVVDPEIVFVSIANVFELGPM